MGLEYCFENVSNMLWTLVIDEQHFGEDNIIHRALLQNKDLFETLLETITIPIVASACPNMFNVFIEVVTDITIAIGEDFRLEFLRKI